MVSYVLSTRVSGITLTSVLELLLLLLLPSRSLSDEANPREFIWPRESPGSAGELDRMRTDGVTACSGGGRGVSLLKTRRCDDGLVYVMGAVVSGLINRSRGSRLERRIQPVRIGSLFGDVLLSMGRRARRQVVQAS